MNSRSDLCSRSRSQTLITIAAKKIPGGRGVLRKRKGREPNLNCFGRVASLSATTTQKCKSVLQIATKERARRNDQAIEVRLTVVAHWAIRTLLNSGRARESELLDDRIGGHLFPDLRSGAGPRTIVGLRVFQRVSQVRRERPPIMAFDLRASTPSYSLRRAPHPPFA